MHAQLTEQTPSWLAEDNLYIVENPSKELFWGFRLLTEFSFESLTIL